MRPKRFARATRTPPVRRRRLLAGIGAACLGVTAGCGGQSDEPTATGSATETATPTATRTATPAPAPTETTTPTPTATPAPEPVTHARGERFVVDDESEPFAYTVNGLRRTDRLLTTTSPEGTVFLVVTCTVENLGGDGVPLPEGDIWLRAPDVRKSASVPASNAAGTDSRVGERSLTEGPLPPDTPRRGVVVFPDAPLAPADYRLLFTPPGTSGPISPDPTDTHRVPIGSLRDVDPIE